MKREFPPDDRELVKQMIEEHHKIFAIDYAKASNSDDMKLVESFRRGDWFDVTSGFLSGSVTRTESKEIYSEFPVAGFFTTLLQICVASWMKQPFSNPMPMMRW